MSQAEVMMTLTGIKTDIQAVGDVDEPVSQHYRPRRMSDDVANEL